MYPCKKKGNTRGGSVHYVQLFKTLADGGVLRWQDAMTDLLMTDPGED